MTDTNLALTLFQQKDLRLVETPIPEPREGEVQLSVRSVGICGSDISYWQHGRIGKQVVTNPKIMGHEPSAVVSKLGPGVTRFKVGDRVAVEPLNPCGKCSLCKAGHYNVCVDLKYLSTPPTNGCLCRYFCHPASFVHRSRYQILDIPDKRKTIKSDSTTLTSIPHLKECESTKEATTNMNIESQRILHEHMNSRHFVQEDKVNLLLPDMSNKLFYKWQGPFHITTKISNLLYEININNLATIPEEEEEKSTPIIEIDVSLPASNQIDTPKVITLDDIALQKVKDTKLFTDHADFFTSVSETFPVLQFESNPESNNIDNTKFHPLSTQRANLLQKGANELLQHSFMDRLNSDLFSHCSIEHSNAKHSATIVLQRQRSSNRKLSFGFRQFLFSPNSNVVQSDIICKINMTWRQQLHKLKDLFFKFRKRTTMTATQKGSELNIFTLHMYYSIFSVT
uniref:Alcohol dehydrogenase-like N-terminal domain-containing protein n=1 Tax=Biomphalaria glabrata TaxID=6526 RepID=A0A2C9JS14_BIOGL